MSPLDALPRPSSKRLAVRVTNDALRQIRRGHPWVFDRSLVSIDKVAVNEGTVATTGVAGDLAVIFDDERRFVAIGLFDPQSPIRIRILDHGKPKPIDDDWWAARLDAAMRRREILTTSSETTGYRVIHGENDGFPGLVADRYASTVVLKIYTAAWLPHLAALVPAMERQLAPERIIVRLSRDLRRRDPAGLRDGDALIGDVPAEPVRFLENGLTFEADVLGGQKTGHFLDQRDNRNRVRSLSAGKRVLDVFSCTGGFSVYAAAGGAPSVHSVDLSHAAIATAARNVAHNAAIRNVRNCVHTSEVSDAFEAMRSLARQRRRFDLVVVDPPSFAQRQSDHDRAVNAYQRLTRLALELVEDDGVLVQSSCSSRVGTDEFYDAINAAAASTSHRIHELVRTGHAVDHPIGFPEGAYLKTLFARVHR